QALQDGVALIEELFRQRVTEIQQRFNQLRYFRHVVHLLSFKIEHAVWCSVCFHTFSCKARGYPNRTYSVFFHFQLLAFDADYADRPGNGTHFAGETFPKPGTLQFERSYACRPKNGTFLVFGTPTPGSKTGRVQLRRKRTCSSQGACSYEEVKHLRNRGCPIT